MTFSTVVPEMSAIPSDVEIDRGWKACQKNHPPTMRMTRGSVTQVQLGRLVFVLSFTYAP